MDQQGFNEAAVRKEAAIHASLSEPYKEVWDRVERIRTLEAHGIVVETCPQPRYWCWQILSVELLPEEFEEDRVKYGEIRQYW